MCAINLIKRATYEYESSRYKMPNIIQWHIYALDHGNAIKIARWPMVVQSCYETRMIFRNIKYIGNQEKIFIIGTTAVYRSEFNFNFFKRSGDSDGKTVLFKLISPQLFCVPGTSIEYLI